jgi:hypothetical protein
MVFLLVKGFRVVAPFLTALSSKFALLLLRVALFVAIVAAVLFREDDLVAVFDWSMTDGLGKVRGHDSSHQIVSQSRGQVTASQVVYSHPSGTVTRRNTVLSTWHANRPIDASLLQYPQQMTTFILGNEGELTAPLPQNYRHSREVVFLW